MTQTKLLKARKWYNLLNFSTPLKGRSVERKEESGIWGTVKTDASFMCVWMALILFLIMLEAKETVTRTSWVFRENGGGGVIDAPVLSPRFSPDQ